MVELSDEKECDLSSSPMENQTSRPPWRPPPSGSWKMNSDAAWLEDRKVGGIGWVIRDSSGSLIGLGCKQMQSNLGIKNLEANAIFEGVKAYTKWSSGLLRGVKPPLVVETDAIEVVKAISSELPDLSELSLLTSAISDFGLGESFSISKCSRLSNSESHLIARAGALYGDYIGFVGSSSLLHVEDEET